MKQIDLRSDTVTLPSPQMRSAMADASVGDDVYGEDPTVNRLERLSAEMLGMEAGLFVSSGTQGNLLALLTHCQRGDEFIAGQAAHAYRWEGGGAAALGGIQPQPLDFLPDGTLDLMQVEDAIKPDDCHYARTRLICLENTQAGKVLPPAYLERAASLAQRHSLSLHLDGARLFNAAVGLHIAAGEISRYFDSVSFCLSKGLGAPVGSVLCGTAEFIQQARRWRKALGGGMRQAGIMAAGGLFALEHNIDRLAEDHGNASLLAEGLASIAELTVDPEGAQTNMVFVALPSQHADSLRLHLQRHGILIRQGYRVRLVTHMDVTSDDIRKVVSACKTYFSRPAN